MEQMSFGDQALREALAGQYVAWRGGKAVIKAETSDDLYDRLNQLPTDEQTGVVIEYMPRTDVVHVY